MNKKSYFRNFYIFVFVLWYSTEIIFNTTLKTILGIPIDKLNNIVNWLVFALLMIQIAFLQSYRKKELIIIIAITLPIIIATVLSGNKVLISAWMFIVGSKNIRFDRIIQIAYRILLIMIPMVILLRLAGIIDDYTMMRGNIQRLSLGFSHPNQLGLRIFQLILCHCYVNRIKLGVLDYSYIIFAVIFTIIFSDSQTAYFSLLVFLIFLLVYKYMKNQSHILKLFVKSLVIGAILLNICSIVLSHIDVNKITILSKIDKWMSSRFSLCHRVWLIYGGSFWGQRIYVSEAERKLVGITNRLWLDNAYVNILLRYGVLVFLITSFAYLYLLKSMVIREEYVLVIILFLYSLYGVMETGLFTLSHNIFLLVFADLLYNKTSTNKIASVKEQFIESVSINEGSG